MSICYPMLIPVDGGEYAGNPNATITAINTSGDIVCSRTSGQTPAFFQVSASAITATGTARPYEDLEYTWDFGDPAGVEVFTNPATGNVLNANSGQVSPEAAYVYRSAGTYSVTLTIRGKNGSGYTTAQVTRDLTVTAFSGTDFYFDSVAGSDANDGLSTGAPKQTMAAINTALAANIRINLKRGSSWSGTTGIAITGTPKTPLRIQAYDSGAIPLITVSGADNAIQLQNGGGASPAARSDVVISNVKCASTTGCTAGALFGLFATGNASAQVDNIYLDNCETDNAEYGVGNVLFQTTTAPMHNCGVWGGAITSGPTPNLGNGVSLFVHIDDWYFVVGATVYGAGSSATLDHHIYPSVQTHSLYKWINFGVGSDKNYCINTNWDGAGGLEFADYICISENNMTGVLRGVDFGNGTNSTALTRFRSSVVERNDMNGLTGDGVVFASCMQEVTVRDNHVWGCTGNRWFAASLGVNNTDLGDIMSAYVYRNLIYKTAGSSAAILLVGRTYTLPQQITDNVIYDTQSVATCIDIVSADQTTAGSTINRNQYYAPNDADTPDKVWFDNGTAKTFAEWQALGWDLNGTVANPNWADPGNGDF